MTAALARDVGAVVELGEVGEPSAETIEVLAAPINPIDLAVARGVLATGRPELPYVPGCEAVIRAGDGRVVWILGGSLGRISHGAIAERAPVGDAHMVSRGQTRRSPPGWDRRPRTVATAVLRTRRLRPLAREPERLVEARPC
jgi:NADPH:quinone reductase-like Zn-dependent oxidoreductase